MTTLRGIANNIDEYIAGFPPDSQVILQKVRETIRAAAPGAKEKISYAIPTFDYKGNLVHFAGYHNHVGFYPGSSGIEKFKEAISGYKNAKGSVQFPLDKPIPYDLITRIVLYRVRENEERAMAKKNQSKS